MLDSFEARKNECRDAFNSVAAVKTVRYKYPSPISVRVTHEERAQLVQAAGDQTLSHYIRHRLFGPDGVSQSFRRKTRKQHQPSVDHIALSRLLGMLGQSRLANNMNQIAKGINLGLLPVCDDLERELSEACADIAEMRSLLLKALGRK